MLGNECRLRHAGKNAWTQVVTTIARGDGAPPPGPFFPTHAAVCAAVHREVHEAVGACGAALCGAVGTG